MNPKQFQVIPPEQPVPDEWVDTRRGTPNSLNDRESPNWVPADPEQLKLISRSLMDRHHKAYQWLSEH